MKYVIQTTNVNINPSWFVCETAFLASNLYEAGVFNSKTEAETFMQASCWCDTNEYKIIEVTNKELFKARLAKI